MFKLSFVVLTLFLQKALSYEGIPKPAALNLKRGLIQVYTRFKYINSLVVNIETYS